MQKTLNFEGKPFLTDAGLETWLVFQQGIDLPHFSALTIMEEDRGVAVLREYFEPFLELAADQDCGFQLESPTWRASPDWAEPLGYSMARLEQLNRDSIALMRELRDRWEDRIDPLIVSGCIGPRGDGYDPAAGMSAEEAADYHGWQASVLAGAGAEIITAITMTNIPEAQGIARAGTRAGVPVAISFTLETDGRLPSGNTLGDAIAILDAEDAPPLHYMINCAHPEHFEAIFANSDGWAHRIRGLRTNASRMSHEELDNSETLDDGDPQELGRKNAELATLLPSLSMLGGCCGTDIRHVTQMCHARKEAMLVDGH